MVRGSCLCGGVRFELERVVGPFELCHCSRCRKSSGSAFVAALGVMRSDLKVVEGLALVRHYDAPIREAPPAYRCCFCARCGSSLPDLVSDTPWLEIPAGLLDDDPALRPDKHIYVDCKAPWFGIGDGLRQFDAVGIRRHREASGA